MFKVILWDIDGTLLDFKAAERAGMKKCFEIFHLGEITDEMIVRYSAINARYWERLERGEITKREVLIGRFEEFFGQEGIETSVAPAFNDEYQYRLGDTICFADHAMETLRYLKLEKGLLQCAVTNGTKEAQSRKLRRSGLDQIFDYIFISDEIGIEKPNKGFFDRVFETLDAGMNLSGKDKISQEEILIVGDSLTSDIRGGNNAGIRTCWYNPHKKARNHDVRLDWEIIDLAQVREIVEQ